MSSTQTGNDYYKCIGHEKPSLAAVRRLRESAHQYLQRFDIDPSVLGDLELVISEYFTNVCKHSPHATRLELGVWHKPHQVFLLLQDNGMDTSGFMSDTQSAAARFNFEEPLESGMGLMLIQSLFPVFTYRPGSSFSPMNELHIPIAAKQANPKIVLIDDDEFQLMLMRLYLELEFEVICFDNPVEALREVPKLRCDLIISDINMPQLDGLTLRRKLALNDKTRMTPFIFLTGYGKDGIREQAAHLSIDDFLKKPIEKNTLLQTISRVINRSRDLQACFNADLERSITGSLWAELPDDYAGYLLSKDYRVAARGGGDLIYCTSCADGLTLLMGDIMGHGDQAKFFAYALAGYLHGICAAAPAKRPASLLTQLAEAVESSPILSKTLLTCQVVQISPCGKILIASAGHPQPFIFNKHEASLTPIEVGGMLLGLAENYHYEEVSVQLDDGNSLILFTDGLLEAGDSDKKEAFEVQMLQKTLDCGLSNSIDAAAILSKFDAIAGASPPDDATVIVITAVNHSG